MDKPITTTNPYLYTVEEVAVLLRRSTKRTYELARKGAFPTKRIGGRIYVPVKQFLAWLEQPDAR